MKVLGALDLCKGQAHSQELTLMNDKAINDVKQQNVCRAIKKTTRFEFSPTLNSTRWTQVHMVTLPLVLVKTVKSEYPLNSICYVHIHYVYMQKCIVHSEHAKNAKHEHL